MKKPLGLSACIHKYGDVFSRNRIPAFAGMTLRPHVIPAKAGIQWVQQHPFGFIQGRERLADESCRRGPGNLDLVPI